MLYRLTRIKSSHPIVCTERKSVIGEMDMEPKIGVSFIFVIGSRDQERGIVTSPVVEVYKRTDGSFLVQTAYSVYELKPIGDN